MFVDSGPSSDQWTKNARDAFASTWDRIPSDVRDRASLGAVTCYRKGCVMEVSGDDAASVLAASDAIFRSPAVDEWLGAKMRTAPSPSGSGRLVSTWVLLPP